MKRRELWLMPLFLFPMLGADVPKEAKPSGKLKSVTEWVTEEDNGKSVTYKDEYEEFDRNGNRLSFFNYKKDGTISEKEQLVYDKFGNRIEEIRYQIKKAEVAGDVFERKTYRYNAYKQKTEECDYNREGGLKSKTLFLYNSHGKKFQEEVYDGKGKLKRKIAISFNAQSRPVQKITTNEKGETIRVQKYIYEYHR